MDSNRFDNLTRRFSRRKAIGTFGAAGLATAMTRTLPSQAQATNATCQMEIQALTSAGPSNGQTYTGILEITFAGEGAIDIGRFTPTGGIAAPVVGQIDGRALSLRITFADGQALVLTGTGENDLSFCAGALSGVFGGPLLGDTGSWSIDPSKSQLDPGSSSTIPAVATATTASEIPTPTPTPCPDMVCDDPFVLNPNSCECGCPPPYELCGFVCCPSGSVCTDPDNGECSCPDGTELCGDFCVSSCQGGEQLDPLTCQCTDSCLITSCPEWQTFDQASCSCIDICDGGQNYYCGGNCYIDPIVNCGGVCYPASSVNSNPNMCGSTCQPCPPGVPCIAGVCQCPVGYGYCAGIGCVSFSDDASNCGRCGNICSSGTSCLGGTCR